jgi:hypothetical protein
MKKPLKSRTRRPVKDLEAKKGDPRGGFVTAVNSALRLDGPPIKVLAPDGPPIRQF